jgi:hypothetical protein
MLLELQQFQKTNHMDLKRHKQRFVDPGDEDEYLSLRELDTTDDLDGLRL